MAAKADGRNTIRAPKIVCTNQVNKPVNVEHRNMEIRTTVIEFSRASAILIPELE